MLRLSSATLLALAATRLLAVDFNQEVRPILAQHCFACHGMDEHSRKAKLRLDLPESAHGKGKSRELAIVAGQPDKSELVRRIFSHDADELMPPPESNRKVTPAQMVRGYHVALGGNLAAGTTGYDINVANAVAAADSSAVRLAKCRYGAAPLTPALRAASATERPATPFAEIRSTAAAMSA